MFSRSVLRLALTATLLSLLVTSCRLPNDDDPTAGYENPGAFRDTTFFIHAVAPQEGDLQLNAQRSSSGNYHTLMYGDTLTATDSACDFAFVGGRIAANPTDLRVWEISIFNDLYDQSAKAGNPLHLTYLENILQQGSLPLLRGCSPVNQDVRIRYRRNLGGVEETWESKDIPQPQNSHFTIDSWTVIATEKHNGTTVVTKAWIKGSFDMLIRSRQTGRFFQSQGTFFIEI